MKRFLSYLVSVITVLSCITLCASAAQTSDSYRYDSRFDAALLAFNDLSLITEEHYALPGLESTVLSGDEVCDAMTPQGLCVSEEFIFISAYCGVKRYKTEKGILLKRVLYGIIAKK